MPLTVLLKKTKKKALSTHFQGKNNMWVPIKIPTSLSPLFSSLLVFFPFSLLFYPIPYSLQLNHTTTQESCNLQLKVISCRHLKAFNFFQKFCTYAVISIVNDESQQKQPLQMQKHKTPINRGDGNPEWNQRSSCLVQTSCG
uniref:C2 domain-containing protein n=1 Tax=Nelumbo nucifera TaxID=4432 RepID=A0A822ZUQ7_NELNU|nr:TPA_asm: hypothetical protein HUJ06_018909 [Nelumbo nucifera]